MAFHGLQRNARGWLIPTDDYLRLFLARPELALVEESCPAEIALHQALREQPSRVVPPSELAGLADADARSNYQHFLAFRAAELLFRPQRIHVQDGQVLCGDQAVLDMLNETGGLGELGRLLTQSKAPRREVSLDVLTDASAGRYWPDAERHHLLLDLTHEITNDLSHGLVLRMARSRSGLTALAGVLERWVAHFLGVQVSIRPQAKVEDAQWRWHIGLDAESSALLNDLYLGAPVSEDRMQHLVSLFRLTFANPLEMRADVAGKPVYLGLGMTADRVVKLKPQNLLLNLPLRAIH